MTDSPWSRPPTVRGRGRPRWPKRLIWWLLGLLAAFLILGSLFPGTRIDSPGEIVAIALLVTIGSAILLSLRLHYREFFRYLAIWSAIVLVLAAAYAFRHEIVAVGDRIAGAALPARGYEAGEAMVFERGPDGHFRVRAEIEGVTVLFLVDTGASKVALTAEDAARIGIRPSPHEYVERYRTANGVVRAAPVTLPELAIGSIRVENVPASVTESDLGTSLLGMSFLNRLSRFEMTGERLKLHP